MKIAQAVPWYYPEGAGGTEAYVAALSAHLMEHDIAVVIAAPLAGARGDASSIIDGIPVFRFATSVSPTRAQMLEREPTPGADAFMRWIEREQPDIVHFHTLTTGLGVREVEAVRELGIRTVFTTHSSSLGHICQRGTLLEWGEAVCDGVRTARDCAACMLQRHGMPRVPAGIIARVGRRPLTDVASRTGAMLQMNATAEWNRSRHARLVAAVDAFVVLTQWAADIVLANHAPAGKVIVNRLGVRPPSASVERAKKSAARGPLRVGYLGRYDEIKGVDVLARAAAALPPDMPIEIVFHGAVRSAAESAISGRLRSILREDARFVVGPELPADRTYDFLADIDVLCCPSLCAEGGPTVALEAHAVGTPVIGSRIGGLSEIIHDDVDGVLLDPGNVTQLTECLVSLERDRSRIDRFRSAIRPVRTMSDVTHDYIHLFERLCSHASAS